MKRLRFFFRKLRSNRRKPFLFGFLILLCLGVTIGYAFLTTTLTIDGAVNVASSRWDIHFENIDIKEGSVEATTTPTITDDTSISFAAVLENPGEFYEFTVDLVNDGTYDAKLDTITITPTLTNEQKEYFDYIVEYTENGEIKVGDALDAGTRENIKVIVQYKVNEDDSKYPGEDINFNFSVTMNYVQGKGNPVSSHQETIITFDSNGGVGTMSNQTIPADTPTSITKNTFTRENYSFNGWNTSSDGTGTKYIDEEEVSDLGEITLFAQWKVDTFPYVFRQEGICTFNGSSSNMTGEDCSDYTSEKYIDTGIKLYSEANKSKDYEIGFTIEEYEPSSNPTQATLMNTKQEASGYPGLVFRKNSDTEFELASRKTSGTNEFYRFSPTGVRDVRIYRINNEIYYKIDDGERTLLNDLTQYNPTFDLNVWFGAAPANATATSAQRYFVGKMSNMYIRLGTYVDEGTYTITLNPNGGTVNPEFINVTAGSPIGTLPTPEKELYNFLGWYTNLTNGMEVTSSYIPDGEMTIFAKWEKKPTYSITFEEDGGEEVEDKEIEQESSVGELPIPVKTGKSFDGWYLENTYTTKVTSSYVPTGNVILYAKWSTTTFPIVFEQTGACTFNGSSGTITGENCSTYVGQKYIDTGISLYSEENKSKDYEIGFTIDSYTPSNNESRATLMNTKLEATGYPGVVFRRNDATDNFALQSRKTSSANEQLIFAYNTVTSVVIYRISNEIYYSINGGEKALLNNLTEYNPTFNLTTWFGAAPSNEAGTSAQRYLKGTLSNMYIKLGTYEEVGKYTITLNPNGGEVTPTTKKITQGDSIGTLPTPTREGYYFDGWYTGLTDGVEVTSDYIPENSMPIYARWKKSVASMIINPEEINVDINEEQMINITNSNEIEEEFTFTSNNSSIATVDNYGKVTGISTGETSITITGVISGDTKIINVFVNQYKIMLNPNGGTVTPTSIRINKGEAIGTIPMPSYSGFVFDGWYTGLTDGIEVNSSYVPTDNITIYARWETKNYLYNVLETAAEEGTYAREYTGEHHDSFTQEPSKKIYHWYASTDTEGTQIKNKNNVIFADHCWQMVRTTDTGGVKMIYNGEAENNQCLSTRGNHVGYSPRTSQNLASNYWYGTDYTYDSSAKTFKVSGTTEQVIWNATTGPGLVGKYTCKNTNVDGTCSTLYLVESYYNTSSAYVIPLNSSSNYSQFGALQFNASSNSPTYMGYMYGDVYSYSTTNGTTSQSFTATQTLLQFTSLGTSYWYAQAIDYGTLTANRYSLVNPYQISGTTDYPNLVGKYTFRSSSQTNTATSVYYIAAVKNTRMYFKQLQSGNLLSAYEPIVFGDSIRDNGDGTYTINNPTNVTLSDWYTNYANYKEKYTCNDSSTTCASPRYTTATTSTNYTYINAGEKIMIGKTRSGLTLTDTLLVRKDELVINSSNYSDYKYTCNTDSATCTEATLRMISGYSTTGYNYAPNHYYGSSVTWDGTNYTLVDPIEIENYNNLNNISTHHYMCVSNDLKTCQTVAYVYNYTGSGTMYYITLRDGVTTVDKALEDMLTKNTTNSTMKSGVDAWYKHYLLEDYDDYIEDTIFCNDRSIRALNGWNPDGGMTNAYLQFKEYNVTSDLSCTNTTDQFSISNNNAKLSYKVGLMSSPEMNILNNNNARKTGQYYWLASPNHFVDNGGAGRNVYTGGSVEFVSFSASDGVRPAVSLTPGTRYSDGNGSMANPYVVD